MKIPLPDWAARHYSPPPSAWVLRQWVRAGQIQPPPEKVGSAYYVEEGAKRQLRKLPPLVDRLKHHLANAA